MGQVLTWCFAAPVVLIFTALLILFCISVILRILAPVSGTVRADEDRRVLDCAACRKKISFVMPGPPRVRCSCGNIMNAVAGKASCPKCREVIHVARRSETLRVKCPCGNVAEVQT